MLQQKHPCKARLMRKAEDSRSVGVGVVASRDSVPQNNLVITPSGHFSWAVYEISSIIMSV